MTRTNRSQSPNSLPQRSRFNLWLFCLILVCASALGLAVIKLPRAVAQRAALFTARPTRQQSVVNRTQQSQRDELSPTVLNQLQALIQAKKSRTTTQNKIDSQIFFTIKLRRGEVIAAGVPTLQTDVKVGADGRVLVDIAATVTDNLIQQIKSVGGEVLSSFPQYNTLRARLPLTQIETFAGLSAIKFISPAAEMRLRSNPLGSQSASSRVRSFRQHQTFAERAARVRTQLSAVLAARAQLPAPPQQRLQPEIGSVTSQGDKTHQADTARSTFSIDGTGVKIGVLSDSVDHLVPSQMSGDLGAVTVLPGQSGVGTCGNPPGSVPCTGEGTAMLEIIHDLAPGAQLFFATANGGVATFAQNIRDLRTAGCDIIVDDVLYLAETPFQDGQTAGVISPTNGGIVAQAVNDVTAAGALYFSSAGNDGNLNAGTASVWEGDFVAGPMITIDGQPVGTSHTYGATTLNTVPAAVPNNGIALLFWSDALGASTNDYDLYLISSDGASILAAADTTQNGTQDPVEGIGGISAGQKLLIVRRSGNSRYLRLEMSGARLSIVTAGQTKGHSASANAFSVAATPAVGPFPNPFNASNVVETFSSDGPRHLFYNANGTAITPGNFLSTGGAVRQKPDITAADGVATSFSPFNPFFGTSAAAPHAAAIAGLLKSAAPSLTPAQIRSALTNTAIDIGASGVDRDSGAGIVMALAALQSVAPSVTLSANPTTQTVTQGQSANYTINVNRTNFTGSVTLSVSNLPSGATASFSPNPTTSNSSLLTINTSASTIAGTFTPSVSAAAAGVTITPINISLTVNSAVNCPTVTNLNPTSGAVGASVVITGANFTSVTAVKFTNNINATITNNTGTQLTVTVPAGATTGPITISKTGCPDVQISTFTVNAGNSPPTISAVAVARQQGSPVSNLTIANANDPDQAANTLTVTVNSGASAAVNGVTVSGISVNAAGVVTANVIAACAATNASFTLTITDSAAASANATLNVTVTANSAPTLSYNNQSVATGGSLNVNPATASDNGSITGYSIVSVTPALSTAPTVNSSGAVSLTNANPPGAHTITIRATDNCGATTDASFAVNVGCPTITLAPTTLPDGMSGTGYSQTITASGGARSYSFSITAGALPGGMSLSPTGLLSGTPTQSGAFNFTVTATDANSCSGPRTYALLICPVITVNPPTIPNGTMGSAYSQTFTATGGTGPYTFSLAGTIPSGLSFAGATLSGTPAQTGSFPITVTATEAGGCAGARGYTLSITGSPVNYPRAYVTNAVSNNVSVIDTATNTVTATVPVGAFPVGVAANAAGTRAYVTNYFSGDVSAIDTATNTVVATVAVGTQSEGVAVNPAGTRAYVTGESTNNLLVIDTSTNTVVATVAVGSAPRAVAVNPAGTRTYVANLDGNNVSVIDTSTNTVVTTVAVGSRPFGMAVNPAGTRVYVTNYLGNNMSVIDTSTNAVVATVAVGSQPTDMAINPAGTRAYIANGGGNNVSVIDASTNTIVATVAVGSTPRGVAVNRAGTRAYVVNADSNNVSVIDTATNTVVATVAVESTPIGVAVTGSCPTTTLSPATLPNGTVGAGYNQTITASGGTPAYSFAVTAGALPNGLALTSGGLLSGTPNSAGAFSFTVTATDANGCTGALSYTVNIAGTSTPQTGFLYVLSDCSLCNSQIFGYAVNETTGALTLLPGFPVLTGGLGDNSPVSERLTIDRINQRLYAINDGSDTVSAFAINSATGALTALPFSPINLGSGNYYTLAVHPSGSPLVVGNGSNTTGRNLLSYQITATTATAAAGSPYGTSNLIPISTVFSQDGNYIYTGGESDTTGIAGYSVNPATGVLTSLPGSIFQTGDFYPLAYATDTAGRLFVTNADRGQVRVFTTTNGIPSGVSGNPFASGLQLAIQGLTHPNGFYLVADVGVAPSSGGIGVYRINGSGSATTLTAVSGSPFTGAATPHVLVLNQAGTLLVSASGPSRNLTTFSVNITTGALTAVTNQSVLGGSSRLDGMVYLSAPCPTIALSPTTLPNGVTGAAYNQTISASPSSSYTFAVTAGALPAGLSLNSATGALTGAPTTAGSSNFIITATSAGGCTGNQTYSITISQANTPPSIAPVAVARQAGSPVSNSTIAMVSDSETAAGALTVNVNGSASATVNNITVSNLVNTNGTITANIIAACNTTLGATNFTINVSDGGLTTPGTLQVTVIANSPPTLSYNNQSVAAGGSLTVNPATGLGDNGSINAVAVFSQGAYTGSISVNSSGVVSISGAKPGGAHTITIRATDNCGSFTDASFTLTVNCQTVSLSPLTLANGTAGTSYNQTITASGGSPVYSFTLMSGTLPTGLSLAAGGALSGTPSAGGIFNFTVKAADANGCVGTQAYSVTINTPPTIGAISVSRQHGSLSTNSTIANVSDADQPANTLTVTVNGLTSATVNGVTVSGIGINAAGVVSANVVASCTATNASFTLMVTDSAAASANATLNVTVTANGAPALSYSNQSVAAGGALNVTPATASDNGSITGFSLQSVTPPLTTTPTVNGSGAVSITNANPSGLHTITIRATDNCGATTDASFTVNVGCPTISLSPSILHDGASGVAYSQAISAGGGAAPYSFAVTAGALPNGLSLGGGGLLSGTPSVAGVSNFSATATDANGCTGTRNYTVNIIAPGAQTGFLYVLNDSGSGNRIYGYAVNQTTGALSLLSGFPLLTGGNGDTSGVSERLAIDRANQRLYAINAVSNTVSAYAVNPTTGALAALPFSPINLGGGSWNTVAVHPSGSPLIVGDGGVGRLLSYQITAATAVAAAGSPYNLGSTQPFSAAFSQDGNYVYTGGNSLSNNDLAGLSVNAATGALAPLPGSPFNSGTTAPNAYATDASGRLFVAHFFSQQVRVFTTTNGVPSAVSGNPFASGIDYATHGLLHPNEFYMVANRELSGGGNQVGVYRINGGGGATTLTAVAGSPFAAGGSFTDVLALNQAGTFLFAANGDSRNLTTFSVNAATGALTTLGTQPVNTLGSAGILHGMAYLATQCPTISLSPATLPGGAVGAAYNQTVTASPSGAYNYSVTAGALPAGLSLNPATGAITGTPTTIGAANFTITATSAGACSGSQAYSITITSPVNTPPSIAPVAVTRQAGSPASNSTIATVSDAETAAGALTVNVNGVALATVNNITVSNLVNTNGTITANVVAACNATLGVTNFIINVSDGTLTTPGTLQVMVNANSPPTLSYANQSVAAGGSLNAMPTTANDNGSITGYAVVSVTPALTTAPTVNASGVVAITNANPSGQHTITIRATDNCGAATDAMFTVNVLSSTITVNSLADTATAGDGQCTLREAINNANAAGQTTAGECNPGGLSTTINFSVTGTINLTGVLPDINSNTTITGPGPGQLDVHRNTGGIYRIFRVPSGRTVAISGLTISNGQADSNGGGGIYNSGTLSLTNCIVAGNTANTPPAGFAGGVSSFDGSLTINNCTISGNIANAIGGGAGGGIGLLRGTLMMSNSTVSGNTASNQGGGLNLQDAAATISNSTISGNTANGIAIGGGILNLATPGKSALVTLINCTITGNTGINSVSTSVITGAISVVTQLKNTLVAANSGFNFTTSGAGSALTSQGNNLVSDGTSGFTNGSNGDIVGTNGSPIDARLGPLTNYGGPTQTHALLCGSPALNAGNNTGAPATDQRGIARPVGGTVDIGAFEANISLSPATLPTGMLGTAYNQIFTASGGSPGYIFSLLSGALPSGLTLNANGLLSGTPAQSGSFDFTVKATDALGFAGACSYTLVISTCSVITINPATIPGAIIGQPYSQSFTQTGGGTVTFSLTGTLPPGLGFNAATATISGTPTQTGSFSVTIKVTDSNGCMGTRTYSLPVNCAVLNFSPALLPNGGVGAAYNQPITVTGGTAPYSLAVTAGGLPTGLTLSSAGVISGTPTQAGTFTFSVTATDANNCGAQFNGYQIVIAPCPTINITPALLPAGMAGATYSQTLTASGGTSPYTFTINGGAVPGGMGLSSGGLLSGTPTNFGTFNLTIKATDANGCMGLQAYNLVINPPCGTITVNPASLPNGFVGTIYSQTLTASGGATPYSFTVSAGNLPGGLTLAPSGALTGTPTTPGTFNFTIKTTDASGCTGTRDYTVVIGGSGLMYYPLPRPIRLFDTRAPISGFPACAYLNQPLAGGVEYVKQARITCDGITIPADAQAIVGNATVVNPVGAGFITLWPDGQTRPPASSLNYAAGQVVANNFTVGLSSSGQFRVYPFAGTDFIVDITGYYAPPQPAGLYYHPLPRPIRLFDTRAPIPGFPACAYLNQPLAGGVEYSKQARITCDGVTIPGDAQAIVGNATVINPVGAGFIVLWPDGQTRPPASSLNYSVGQVVANGFTVGLSGSGQFRVYPFAGTDFIVDIAGYYSPSPTDANGTGLLYSPLPRPIRLFDTRAPIAGFPACAYLNQPLIGGVEYPKQARITCDGVTIPAEAQAIVGNATVVNPVGAGFITLWPDGQTRPPASSLNYAVGQVVANGFTVGLSSSGQFRVYPFAGTDFIVDIAGFFAP